MKVDNRIFFSSKKHETFLSPLTFHRTTKCFDSSVKFECYDSKFEFLRTGVQHSQKLCIQFNGIKSFRYFIDSFQFNRRSKFEKPKRIAAFEVK